MSKAPLGGLVRLKDLSLSSVRATSARRRASKLSRGAPRLPFWQGSMRSQQPSRTVVDRLVDEIPLRVEGRSCDEHLFRTESDPERTSVKQ